MIDKKRYLTMFDEFSLKSKAASTIRRFVFPSFNAAATKNQLQTINKKKDSKITKLK
jgi:hypothetical protein